jgi:1,2-diacylglycerol 3-beta-galactosyltransferase
MLYEFRSKNYEIVTNTLLMINVYMVLQQVYFFLGQEAGNVPYVVENGCGKFSKSPKEIAQVVSDWFGTKWEELHAMSQNCLKLARPDAVFKIVHDLHELAREKSRAAEFSYVT